MSTFSSPFACIDSIPRLRHDGLRHPCRLSSRRSPRCTVGARRLTARTLWLPRRRFARDLPREIDLIEEVLRLWGMDRIPPTLPAAASAWAFAPRSSAACPSSTTPCALAA